jgi:hypothetical protein
MKTLRTAILKRLENLRKRHSAHYAQIVALPFSLPPAYAMEDDKSDWWKSDEAKAFFESLNERELY